MMAKLPKELLEKGVICSSAGNHAQGVALAAERLKCNAVIVMPVTTPEIKVLVVSCFTWRAKASLWLITLFSSLLIKIISLLKWLVCHLIFT